MKKLLPYLLINVAVSAVTMLAVILIWSAFHPSPTKSEGLDALNLAEATPTEVSLPPLDRESVEIQSVFMPGERDYEKITLENVSEEPIDLTNWKLSNLDGEDYLFPALTLYPNGALTIYSLAGADTAVELYWNADGAVWKSGESAVLYDSAGQERSRYLIP